MAESQLVATSPDLRPDRLTWESWEQVRARNEPEDWRELYELKPLVFSARAERLKPIPLVSLIQTADEWLYATTGRPRALEDSVATILEALRHAVLAGDESALERPRDWAARYLATRDIASPAGQRQTRARLLIEALSTAIKDHGLFTDKFWLGFHYAIMREPLFARAHDTIYEHLGTDAVRSHLIQLATHRPAETIAEALLVVCLRHVGLSQVDANNWTK